jgi:hypothetical protein
VYLSLAILSKGPIGKPYQNVRESCDADCVDCEVDKVPLAFQSVAILFCQYFRCQQVIPMEKHGRENLLGDVHEEDGPGTLWGLDVPFDFIMNELI